MTTNSPETRTLHELLEAGDITPEDRSRYQQLIADVNLLVNQWQINNFEGHIFEAPTQSLTAQRPAS